MKVVLCVPTLTRPYQVTLDSIAASVPLLDELGWDHYMVSEIGCPYISAARSTMLRRALDHKPDAIVFIDHDLSWEPHDLALLLETEGDYVVGTYRFKREEVEYMGQLIPDANGRPIVRDDGALQAFSAPAGFMKITPRAVNRMIEAHPELCYGERHSPHFDFFNHGAHKHVWYGEDYAACRRWIDAGEKLWLVPDLDLTHWSGDTPYPGNYHQYLLRQPGGSEAK